jgi:hypothetical protein
VSYPNILPASKQAHVTMQLSGTHTLLLCLLAGASACVLLVAVRRQQQQQGSTLKDAGITEDACLDWLRANMPERDRGKLSEARLRSHIRLALTARTASAWAAAVPLELWLNDVLPYRSVDEPLDSQDWRPMFVDRFMPLVSGASSLSEAAQLLNRCATPASAGWQAPQQALMAACQVADARKHMQRRCRRAGMSTDAVAVLLLQGHLGHLGATLCPRPDPGNHVCGAGAGQGVCLLHRPVHIPRQRMQSSQHPSTHSRCAQGGTTATDRRTYL